MTRPQRSARLGHGRSRTGFTLVELLVVVLIVVLVSVITLRTAIPALSNQQVTEGARILQAAIAGAHDSAIRFNAPRGFRLIPDMTLSQFNPATVGFEPGTLTSNRIIALEPAPDITDQSLYGTATFATTNATWLNSGNNPPVFPFPASVAPANRGYYPHPALINGTTYVNKVLMIVEAQYQNNDPTLQVPNPPTNWFLNVRIGDRFRFSDSGRYYTVVGPMTIANPENFVNDGQPGASGTLQDTHNTTAIGGGSVTVTPEFLFLVNGQDDTGLDTATGYSVPLDGYIDNGFDSLDVNYAFNGPGQYYTYPDFASNGLPLIDDINEWVEIETWLGVQASYASPVAPPALPKTFHYVITRRPVPVPGAREVQLPGSVVIDMTTWYSTAERSRLPVDPNTGYVDIMINQSGQVVPTTEFSSPSGLPMAGAFYHFWIADRSDVFAPLVSNGNTGPVFPSLPMPQGTANYTGSQFLKKDRRLVTLFTRSGQVLTSTLEDFDGTNVNRPYYDAQLGIREAK